MPHWSISTCLSSQRVWDCYGTHMFAHVAKCSAFFTVGSPTKTRNALASEGPNCESALQVGCRKEDFESIQFSDKIPFGSKEDANKGYWSMQQDVVTHQSLDVIRETKETELPSLVRVRHKGGWLWLSHKPW